MICKRCGQTTERYTVDQRYCPVCAAEVKAILAAEAKRERNRVWNPKDMTGRVAL